MCRLHHCVCFQKLDRGQAADQKLLWESTNSKQWKSLEWRLVRTQSRTLHSAGDLCLRPAASTIHRAQWREATGKRSEWGGRHEWWFYSDVTHIWMSRAREVSSALHFCLLHCQRTLSEHLQDVQAAVVTSCIMTHSSASVPQTRKAAP